MLFMLPQPSCRHKQSTLHLLQKKNCKSSKRSQQLIPQCQAVDEFGHMCRLLRGKRQEETKKRKTGRPQHPGTPTLANSLPVQRGTAWQRGTATRRDEMKASQNFENEGRQPPPGVYGSQEENSLDKLSLISPRGNQDQRSSPPGLSQGTPLDTN